VIQPRRRRMRDGCRHLPVGPLGDT
jgi:hypothetical protein